MLIVQECWSAGEPEPLRRLLRAGLRQRGHKHRDELVLLPAADDVADPGETVGVAGLAALAEEFGIHLAGAARSPAGRLVGFLFGPDGRQLLETPKMLPELLESEPDPAAFVPEPGRFEVARTPHGQLAILVGEDALVPHLVRAAMWRGAEVILNPARERSDEHFGIRQQARMARAYENHCQLVTASASRRVVDGFVERLPPASAAYDEWAFPARTVGAESFLRVDLDLESMRRRRVEHFGNLCIVTRPTVYAPGYRAVAEAPRSTQAWQGAAPPRADAIDRYDVLLGQVTVRHVIDEANAAETLRRNVDHALEVVGRFSAAPDTRLVVFPEFFLQGSRIGRMPQLWPAAAINLRSSPHIERLAKFAQANKVFLCGAVLESDDDWPGYLFNTAFILDDDGELIHRYRKIQCADVFGFMDTTPGSILERYLDRYGYEALFPVADTKIGRLATAICFDMNFPELHRALALRGAELLLHPTAEPHNVRRRAWENSRQVRAWENTMYVLSAALGGDYWEGLTGDLSMFSRGHTKVVNYDGTVQSVADGPGPVPLGGQIDLRGLRAARADARHCMLHWDRPQIYEAVYSSLVTIPDNLAARSPDDRPYEGGRVLKAVIQRFIDQRIFVAPRGGATTAGAAAAPSLELTA
jgi:predicted amidohydrolase